METSRATESASWVSSSSIFNRSADMSWSAIAANVRSAKSSRRRSSTGTLTLTWSSPIEVIASFSAWSITHVVSSAESTAWSATSRNSAGRQDPPRGVLPAQQGLEAEELAVRTYQRLVVQGELAAGEGVTQLALEVQLSVGR